MKYFALVLALPLLMGADDGRFYRERCSKRSGRDFICGASSFADLEFAPTSGVGMGLACAGTTPTGAKGETLTYTRASQGTCLKGHTTAGIATGDLAYVSNNVPAIMPGGTGNGALGILIEGARTNDCLRSDALDNVVWTATATVAANSVASPDGTTNADTLTDGSGGVSQGVCQNIVTASATRHSFSAFVRGGSVTSATLTMTGTGSATGDCSVSVTGLSGTTWNRPSCASSAAYAGTLTAVTVCIVVGNAASATGDIYAFGADHEVGPAATSYIATVGTAATRAVVSASFDRITTGNVSGSIAASRIGVANTLDSGGFYGVLLTDLTLSRANGNSAYLLPASGLVRCIGNGVVGQASNDGATSGRMWCAFPVAGNITGQVDGITVTPGGPNTSTNYRYVVLGEFNGTSVSYTHLTLPTNREV